MVITSTGTLVTLHHGRAYLSPVTVPPPPCGQGHGGGGVGATWLHQPPKGHAPISLPFLWLDLAAPPQPHSRGEHHPGDSGTRFQDTQLGLGLKGEREALHTFQGSCDSTTSRQ